MWNINESEKFIKDSGKRGLSAVITTIVCLAIFPIAAIGYVMLLLGKLFVLPYEWLVDYYWYVGDRISEETEEDD